MTEKRTRNANAPLDQFQAASRLAALRKDRDERRLRVTAEFNAAEQAAEEKILARVPEELRGQVTRLLEVIDGTDEYAGLPKGAQPYKGPRS